MGHLTDHLPLTTITVLSHLPLSKEIAINVHAAVPGSGAISHAVLAGAPDTIAQITERLFPVYTVHAGRVHLAGCTLDDRLFARLTYLVDGKQVELLVDDEGKDVDLVMAESLHLYQTRRITKEPPLAGATLGRWLDSVLPQIEKQRFASHAKLERISLVIVWCKFATGKLRFTIGKQTAELPFAGWVRTIDPPPWVCPYSGVSTFELALTDDHRIVAAQEIATCEETGQRVLAAELVTCAATGKRVLSGQTCVCPVSGVRVITHEMVTCDECGEEVSPTAIDQGRCQACHHFQSISQADPRLVHIFTQYPQFSQFQHWKLSETTDRYLLLRVGWIWQVLVVIDKDSLELRRVAKARRLLPRWRVVNGQFFSDH